MLCWCKSIRSVFYLQEACKGVDYMFIVDFFHVDEKHGNRKKSRDHGETDVEISRASLRFLLVGRLLQKLGKTSVKESLH